MNVPTPPDFSNLLNVNLNDIERPKPMPVGTYSFLIKGMSTGTSKEKKTPYVRFDCQPVGFEADVDPNALTAAKIDLSKRTLTLDFFITQDALWRLKEFLGKIGIATENRMLPEALAETQSKAFKAYVTHELVTRPGQEPDIFNRIDTGKILPA